MSPCRQVDSYFEKFDMDEDGMLDEDEFLRCIIRELSRKTAARWPRACCDVAWARV